MERRRFVFAIDTSGNEAPGAHPCRGETAYGKTPHSGNDPDGAFVFYKGVLPIGLTPNGTTCRRSSGRGCRRRDRGGSGRRPSGSAGGWSGKRNPSGMTRGG